MPRPHTNRERPSLAYPVSQSSLEYPIYRTRDILGRERFVMHAHGRRYLYRSIDAALQARARLIENSQQSIAESARRGRRYRRVVASVLLTIVVLSAIVVSQNPPLLLQTVDWTRSIVGPAPIAYAETFVFRIGTLIRQMQVRLGDTAPRWTLEQNLGEPTVEPDSPVSTILPTAAVQSQAAAEISTATVIPTLPPSTIPSAVPTTEELMIGNGIIMRGGNLRSAPYVAAETLVGLVWPGDQIAFLERRAVGNQTWLRVRLTAAAENRQGQGVDVGGMGWISAVLLVQPTAVPTITLTAPLMIKPTPIPARSIARPIPSLQPQLASGPSAVTTVPVAPMLPTPVPTRRPLSIVHPPAPAPGQTTRGNWPPAPLKPLINDGQLPNEGQWQLLSAIGDRGAPAMAATLLRPDSDRPDIQAAIVAIDLTRASLHMTVGTEEPPGPPGIARSGTIPDDLHGMLLAAFNGGFKAIHGNDGMSVDGVTYIPPAPYRATVAVTSDGRVRFGLWGRDFDERDNLQAWRQNGALLVDGGVVTDRARQGGLGWGTTVDLQAETWRSAIGISADGRTLFYAVGDALTASRLAEVIRAAGAWSALQLDINNYWVRFVTFQRTADGRLMAQPLISAMPRESSKYLVPEKRDFFYITAR